MSAEPGTPVGPQAGTPAATADQLVMLVGGPRHGHQERVASGVTVATVNVDGIEHTYQLGANLPADFPAKLPPPHYPTSYFGYSGPDQEYIDQLTAEYGGAPTSPPPPPAPPQGRTLTTENFPMR